MNQDFFNLTTLSVGFPPQPTDEIYRENIIKNIAESFSGDKQVILISDGPQTGKTTTLAQFARQYSNTAISYFISSNPWTQNVQNFLYTICTQISCVLGTKSPDETNDFNTLYSLLGTLSIKLAHNAKKTGNIYYFVIDGLEYSTEGPHDQRIIDLLPLLTDANSPFMLASCRSDFLPTLSRLNGLPTFSVVKFSTRETQEYLKSLGLPEDETKHLHDKYGGIPGQLKIIKELVQNSTNKNITAASLPLKLDELVTRQWTSIYEHADVTVKQALEMLAAIGMPISADALSSILNLSSDHIISKLSQTGFVDYEEDLKVLRFSSKISYDAVRNLLADKLLKLQENTIHSLENLEIQGTEISDLLSSLYKQTGNYKGIENQLRSEIIIHKLQSEDSLASLYRDLFIACEMAQDETGIDSTSAIMKWGFGISLLKLVTLFPVDEDEVEALLSVNREQEVVRRAYSIAETSTRIRLLARSYTSLKKRGQRIPGEAQTELQKLIDTLNLENIDHDLLVQTATELFPLFPDTATKLLEKAVKSNEKRNIIDLALTTATLSSPLKPDEQTLSSINNPDLAYVAKAHSSWLSSLPLSKLREEVSNVKSTKAKEYLIRKWCRTNPTSEELASGIEFWIAEVISDINFPIPLRSLRQVSDSLLHVKEKDIKFLVEKLEIPRITGLDSPKEELIRFLLNLAEATYRITPQEAATRWSKAKEIILNEILDLDTKVYCLSRLWVSASRILENRYAEEEVKSLFRQNLEKLLNGAADHYEVTKGVIKTLIMISPIEAIDVATKLNLRTRRNNAIGLALGNLLLERGTENWLDILDVGFGYAKAVDHQFIISDIFYILEDEDKQISTVNLEFLAEKAKELPGSETKAQYLSILSLFEAKNDIERANIIAKNAIEYWQQINDLRVKMKTGYQLVSQFSRFNLGMAETLLKDIEKLYLYPEAKLASGNLAPALLYCIRLAIRALTLSDFTNRPEEIEILMQLIARIPSEEVQKKLFGELAASAYRNGYSQYAEKILQEKILIGLIYDPLSSETIRLLIFCAPLIFEYDPQKTKELLSMLPDNFKDNSWHRIIVWKIAQLQLEDNVDIDNFKVPVGQRPILSAIEALENITLDGLIYDSIKTIINVTENSFDRKKIDATQALDIAHRISLIVNKHLPDPDNILHEGYKIISLAVIQKLKSKIGEKNKFPGLSRSEIKKGWKDIEALAQKIPNTADRVYVISLVAQEMLFCTNSKEYGEELLLSALEEIKDIPSVVDRGNRLQLIASTLEKAGLKTQAKFAVEQAVELSSQLEGIERRDLVSWIVQVAHRIDPELASELTLRLDSRIEGVSDPTAKISLDVEKLVGNPAKLSTETDELFRSEVLSKASARLFDDIVIGVGTVPHERVFNQWLRAASITDISTFYDVALWVIECMKRRGGRDSSFEVISQMPRFTFELIKSISPQRRLGVSDLIIDSYPGLASKVHVFEEGERNQAIEWVSKWIGQWTKQYIKLCDPYFQVSEIMYFRDIPENCKIVIVTTDKYLKSDRDNVIRDLIQAWNKVSSRRIPNILMYIVPETLEAIFHDRTIVTKGAGLDLGQSLNGLGLKSGKLTELADADAQEVESEYFDQMLNQSNWFLNHSTVPVIINI